MHVERVVLSLDMWNGLYLDLSLFMGGVLGVTNDLIIDIYANTIIFLGHYSQVLILFGMHRATYRNWE